MHSASHGGLAGQLSGTSGPNLILTPPDEVTKENDGYLSCSEITSLKLDTDWVILSACNTAGDDDATNAEALYGLALGGLLRRVDQDDQALRSHHIGRLCRPR